MATFNGLLLNLRKNGGETGFFGNLKRCYLSWITNSLLLVSGTGEVIEPDDGVLAIGSGGHYALAAGRALKKYSGHSLTAAEIAQAALETAAEICVYHK